MYIINILHSVYESRAISSSQVGILYSSLVSRGTFEVVELFYRDFYKVSFTVTGQ